MAEVGGEFVEVGDGLECLFVTGQAEVSDACFWHDFEDAMDHTQACSEDWDDGDGALEPVCGGGGDGGLDLDGGGFE